MVIIMMMVAVLDSEGSTCTSTGTIVHGDGCVLYKGGGDVCERERELGS